MDDELVEGAGVVAEYDPCVVDSSGPGAEDTYAYMA